MEGNRAAQRTGRVRYPDMSWSHQRRVSTILRLMRRNEWSSDLVPEYAKQFGVTMASVRRDALEAKRILFGGMTDEELSAMCASYLDTITNEAIQNKCYGPAVQAVKVLLESRGLLSKTTRLESVTPMTPPELVRAIVDDPQLRPMVARALLEEKNGIVTEGVSVSEGEENPCGITLADRR
jgi:hypothetical protein